MATQRLRGFISKRNEPVIQPESRPLLFSHHELLPDNTPVPINKRSIASAHISRRMLSSSPSSLYHPGRFSFPMVQTRGYAFFSRGPKSDIAIVEEEANRLPNDASRQAALYRELLAEGDAASVIRRFEDRRWARDRECVVQYLVALFETSQLERAVGAFLSQSHPSASPSSAPPADMPRLVIGTKERPVVVQVEGGRGSGWRRVGTVVNIVFVGGLLYAMLGMNEQRLEGLTGRVHKQFGPEDTSKLATFDDVQGCDEAKQELEDIVAFLKDPGRFTRHGAHMPRGILLVGPPGTGKTLLARAVAGEAGVPFFYASGSSFDELFVGVGSMRIRKLFEAARKSSPAIVFIDELDAIGSKRNPRDPQHARMSLNQLLTELDGFAQSSGVIVLAATNIPEALDRALLRPGRFDKQVHVPLPDMRGRRAILERYIAKGSLTLAPDVDVPLLARGTPGFSGADLAKLVNQARIMASLANEPELRQAHLEASKDEMIMGAERKSALIAPEERLLTAYHEGGHALVALRSQNAMPIHKATIVPRGQALGMVSQLPEKDELSLTRAQLLARLDVAMGGRAAEQLVYGSDAVTTGASSDFQQATAIARAMVTQYGMSERLGPLNVSPEDLEALSPSTRDLIDAEIKTLLLESQARATKILSDHKRDLDRLARALVQYETLSKAEIEALLTSNSPLDHLF